MKQWSELTVKAVGSPAESPAPGHSSPSGVSRPLSVLAITIAAILTSTAAAAAEPCFKDDTGRIVKRRRPGYVEVPCPVEGEAAAPVSPPRDAQYEGGSGREARRQGPPPRETPTNTSPIPRPAMVDYQDAVPIPDRWRIVEALGYKNNIFDPYNRNVLKADRPVYGEDWFFSISLISDTFAEVRDTPVPVGGIAAEAGKLGIFGGDNQMSLQQNVTAEFVYYKGNTTFKPPDYEFRLTPVINYNYLEVDELQAVNQDPRDGTSRSLYFVGLQAAFIDKHLRNVTERFDFDSFRIGIQPFSSDFRGFLFQDSQLGVRLFGTRDNNLWQYNLAAFRRLEKDTNSGLNDVGRALRDDDIYVANLYRQDWPVLGFVSQATVLYNRNRESDRIFFNKNEIIERPASLGREQPRDYDITYIGYNGDGHFGRWNVTTSLYYAIGDQTPGTFVTAKTDIEAFFAAAEVSFDFDWIRPRFSFLYASGDDDPTDDKSTGFDAPFENPQFAGSDTSYAIRQSIPLIGGGKVALSSRNGILNNLRSSKEQGQSNFDNPGTMLIGAGVDLDVMPEVRLTLNANALYMTEPEILERARLQADVDNFLGYDLSASLIWRPLQSQNIVIRAAYATILPEDGFKALFPDQDLGYFMLNAVFAY
jgi:hypothetical protein